MTSEYRKLYEKSLTTQSQRELAAEQFARDPAAQRDHLVACLGDLASHLDDETFWNGRLPWNHQRAAILSTWRHFANPSNDNAAITIVPTGGGKTHIFSHIIGMLAEPVGAQAQLQPPSSIILVPTEDLIEQTKEKLEASFPTLPVGVFYGRKKDVKPLTVMTYDSFMGMAESGRITPEDVQYLVMDEAHEGLSERRIDVFNAFRKKTTILAYTASPAYDAMKNVYGLLDEKNTVANIPISLLVAEKVLAPIHNYVVRVDVNLRDPVMVRTLQEHPTLRDQLIERAQYQAAYDFTMRHRNAEGNLDLVGKPTIGFVNSMRQSQEAASFFNQRVAPLVKDKTPIGKHFSDFKKIAESLTTENQHERKAIIGRLKKAETAVVFNVDMLSRGNDFPKVETVLRLNETGSIVRELQGSGRATRSDPENPDKIANIINFSLSVNGKPRGKPCYYFEAAADPSVLKGVVDMHVDLDLLLQKYPLEREFQDKLDAAVKQTRAEMAKEDKTKPRRKKNAAAISPLEELPIEASKEPLSKEPGWIQVLGPVAPPPEANGHPSKGDGSNEKPVAGTKPKTRVTPGYEQLGGEFFIQQLPTPAKPRIAENSINYTYSVTQEALKTFAAERRATPLPAKLPKWLTQEEWAEKLGVAANRPDLKIIFSILEAAYYQYEGKDGASLDLKVRIEGRETTLHLARQKLKSGHEVFVMHESAAETLSAAFQSRYMGDDKDWLWQQPASHALGWRLGSSLGFDKDANALKALFTTILAKAKEQTSRYNQEVSVNLPSADGQDLAVRVKIGRLIWDKGVDQAFVHRDDMPKLQQHLQLPLERGASEDNHFVELSGLCKYSPNQRTPWDAYRKLFSELGVKKEFQRYEQQMTSFYAAKEPALQEPVIIDGIECQIFRYNGSILRPLMIDGRSLPQLLRRMDFPAFKQGAFPENAFAVAFDDRTLDIGKEFADDNTVFNKHEVLERVGRVSNKQKWKALEEAFLTQSNGLRRDDQSFLFEGHTIKAGYRIEADYQMHFEIYEESLPVVAEILGAIQEKSLKPNAQQRTGMVRK